MGAAKQPIKERAGVVILTRNPRGMGDVSRLFAGLDPEHGDLPVAILDMVHLDHVDPTVKLVVLDLENWLPSDELALNELRKSGYAGPVIVLTKRLAEAASLGYTEERIVFYDRSHGENELMGIGKRLIRGGAPHPRKHPRHFTNENAELRLDGQPHIYAVKIGNLSKGGALVEVERSFAIRVGDVVVLKIHLTQLNRLYSVRARVAWVRMPRFGVEFIGE